MTKSISKLDIHIVLDALAFVVMGEPLAPEFCRTIESIAKEYKHPDFGEKEIQALYDFGPTSHDRSDPTKKFLDAVQTELKRAREKFPGDRVMTIALAEEFGELCKAVLDEKSENIWKEAIQTAVMAARVAIDGDGSVKEWRAAKGLDLITAASLKESQPVDSST